MALIEQIIPSIAGGVSQRPQAQRGSSQADAQLNVLNHPTRGASKRPPLAHLAKLTADVSGLDTGFTHEIALSSTERFLALVRNGAVTVYDKATGGAVPVEVVSPDVYLAPVAATEVAEDPFTDLDTTTLLTHAIAAAGGLWTKWFSTDPVFYTQIASNRLRFQRILTGTKEAYLWPDAPGTPDYTVEATVRRNSTGDVHLVGPIGRITVGAGGYAALMDGVNGVSLKKFNAAGVLTNIVNVAQVWVAETDYQMKMVFLGTNIKVYLDGVLKINQTDASFALAGLGGIYGEGNQSGGTPGQFTYIDNYKQTYLAATTSARAPIRAVQVGKQSIIANTTIPVRRGSESAPNKQNKALVAVRQADYGTQYAVTLDGQTISFGSADGVTPQARTDIDTTKIAARLKYLIDLSVTLDAFTITQYGSTLLVEKTDGSDFTILADDGLADNGLLVVKASVQSFTDLPAKAPADFTVEVTGDASNEFDNYFVRFDVTDTATNAGVWKECVKPGEPIALDRTTMPHTLTYKGSLIPTSEAAGTPPAPAIVPGGGVAVADFFDAIDESPTLILTGNLRNHGDDIDAFLAGANGIATDYSVTFDIDSRAADADDSVDLIFLKRTGVGTFVELTRRTFGPEVYRRNEVITASNVVIAAGGGIRMKLEYASGVTPTDSKRTFVRFRQQTALSLGVTEKPINFVAHVGKKITFESTRKYPQGALIRVTCDGINFDLTPGTDMTGAAVATALQLLIDAHATFIATNPSAGQILVTRVDAANPVVTCAITWSEATTYHDPSLALTVGAIVGKTIKNLTDNSEGTVTANTATTITVLSIAGGFDNTFHKGDKIEVYSAGRYFTFAPATWDKRVVGDLLSNPMPSIVDQKINDVLITKGRLGFVSGGNIVLSEVGNLFNVFRTTVTQLLDGDPIDVKPAHGEAVRFHSYSAWAGRDIFWSGRHQFELSGEPLLSPKTVKLLPITEYPMDEIRPVVLGRFAYFVATRAASSFAQVYAYQVMPSQETPEAVQLTEHVDGYLAGSVLAIAGDEELGMFAVLTDADRTKLFINTFDRATESSAWTVWQFPAGTSVVDFSFLDGLLTILSKRSDGAYLDTLDAASLATIGLLDRKKTFAVGTGVFSAGSTTWTLPYSCATGGTEGVAVVVNATTGAVIASTRPTATTIRAVGDFSAVAVIIGITYTYSHTLSTVYPRNSRSEANEALTSGRLQLLRLRMAYEDTRDFTVTVTPAGRTARAYTVAKTTDTDGFLSVPVGSQNTAVSIVITNSLPSACRFTEVQWEGTQQTRGH